MAATNIINGTLGPDVLSGTTGNDTVNGNAGTDTFILAGTPAGYRFGLDAARRLLVTDIDSTDAGQGTDTLQSVEILHFADRDWTVEPPRSEFRVNTRTAGDQDGARLVALRGGGFVVVWTSPDGQDASHTGVYAQRYDSFGLPVGGEIRVGSRAGANQFGPEVAALGEGGFVVTWTESLPGPEIGDETRYGLYGQRFDREGLPMGAAFDPGAVRDSVPQPSQSRLTALKDGGFVVSWVADPGAGSETEVFALTYDASGKSTGQAVDLWPSSYHYAIVPLSDGGFVLAAAVGDTADRTIAVQRYTGAGIATGAATSLGNAGGFKTVGGVFPLDSGYVVTWTEDGGDKGPAFYSQRFTPAGTAVGGPVPLDALPTIAALADGGYVSVWMAGGDGSGQGLFGQRFDRTGQAVGQKFRINTHTLGDQTLSGVTRLDTGGFIVTWASGDGSDVGVFGQRYDATGKALGSEFRFNARVANAQDDPRAVALAGGGVAVVWQSAAQDGSGRGVYGRVLDQDGSGLITVRGSAQADAMDFSGGQLALRLAGGAGNDTLQGGAANDVLLGGEGDDSYRLTRAGDRIVELANGGYDTVRAGYSATLDANVEVLILSGGLSLDGTGNAQANTLRGNTGNNVLDGGGGRDILRGGIGNDTYVVNNLGVIVSERFSQGTDTVRASVNHALAANVENLVLTGSAAINGSGNSLANVLTGNSAGNTLAGGPGNDTYRFGLNQGADTLIDADTTIGNSDTLQLDTGITRDQLWFRHVGADLEVSLIGTASKVTVQNWYSGASNRIEQIRTADGKMLVDTKVEALVSAMAGLTPPAPGQTTLPADYRTMLGPVIAASWS